MLRLIFIMKLIGGLIDSPFLLGGVQFNVPSRPTRNFSPINLTLVSSNYAAGNPLRALFENYNNYSKIVH